MTNPIVTFRSFAKASTKDEMELSVAQEIICRLLKAEFRVQFQAIPCGICGGQSGVGIIFSPNASVLPCHYHFINVP